MHLHHLQTTKRGSGGEVAEFEEGSRMNVELGVIIGFVKGNINNKEKVQNVGS